MQRALVIDDDAFFRQVVADMLEKLGYEPVHAATGSEGMEKFLAREPDIILLDLNLPDVHGFELLEHFAQREMAGRVIVTTSDYSLDSALRALRAGAADYLPKPIRQEQLRTSVERIGRNLAIQRENQMLHHQLRKRVQDLKLMRHIAQLANSTRPASEWTNDITTAVCNYIGAEAGSLLLLRDEQTLVFYTAAGPAREKLRTVELPRSSGGLAWWCIEHLEPVKMDDPAGDGRFNPEIDRQTGFTTRNLLAVPITVGGKPVGVMEVLNKKGAATFGRQDLELLTELCDTMAVAIRNALVADQLAESRRKLAEWSELLEQKVEERTRELQNERKEKEKAYEELLASHQRLKHAQALLLEREKAAALGLLGAGVAHEINNPLGFVRSNIDTLQHYVRAMRRVCVLANHAARKSHVLPFENLKKILDEIRNLSDEEGLDGMMEDISAVFEEISEGLGRIALIVEQLRIVAEEGDSSENPERCDIEKELRRSLQLVGSLCTSSGSADMEECTIEPLPAVKAPLKPLRRLLLSILGAGAHPSFGPLGRVNAQEADGKISIEYHFPEASLERSDLPRLFDPFFQPGDKLATGGLGLSAAHAMALSMGGRLSAAMEDRGIVMKLELPAATAVTAEAS